MPDPVTQEVTTLTSTERARLFAGRDLWGSNGLGARKLHCQQPQRRWVRYADVAQEWGIAQLPVSHVGMVELGEAHAGLGSIVTTEDARRQGHAAALVRDVLAVLRAEGYQRAFLMCLDHRLAYYRKTGWWDVPAEVTVDQPTGRVVVAPPYHVLWRVVDATVWSPPLDTLRLGRPW